MNDAVKLPPVVVSNPDAGVEDEEEAAGAVDEDETGFATTWMLLS